MTQRQWATVLITAALVAIPSGVFAGVVLSVILGGGNATVYATVVLMFLLGIGVAKRKVEEQEIHEHTLNEVRGRH